MPAYFSIDIKINKSKLRKHLQRLISDPVTMLEVQSSFARFMNPYVPMDEGTLSQTPQVTEDGVRYTQPYAHYQYIGDVYGPNIPITENGVVVGFFSKPGKTKTPTGEQLTYNKDRHPLASDHWDQAMMASRGADFKKQVTKILAQRYKELYGR